MKQSGVVMIALCVGMAVAGGIYAAEAVESKTADAPLFAKRYDLRVYGPLTAQELPPLSALGEYRHLRLTAADGAKAELLHSKVMADFTTLPTIRAERVKGGAGELSVLVFHDGRSILPLLRRREGKVDLYCFATPKARGRFLDKAQTELAGGEQPDGRRHPYYLDFWDRHCMGFWYRLFQNSPGQSDTADFAFLKKHDLTVNTVSSIESTAARARLNGLGYKINRWFDVGDWAYEAHPEAANGADPDMTAQGDYYGEVPFAENPIERNQVAEMSDYLRQFTDDEYLLSITDPHGETGPFPGSYSGARDRNEFSRRDFVHYLRDRRGFDVAQLGERWYGDPRRFASWDALTFPRERDFFGWRDGVSQDLGGAWRARVCDRATGEKEQLFATAHDDARWIAFQQPGCQLLAGEGRAKEKNGGWLRHSFVPDELLLKSGKPIMLTICPFNHARYDNPSTIYLNGEKIADLTFGYGQEWGQIDVTKLLKPGANVLAAYTPIGYVLGPTFLTLNRAESFPTSDKGLNARLHDVREWVADMTARANVRYIEHLRGIDPNRPVKLMAFDSMLDVMMPNLERLGAYPHCTGEGAFFRPWFKRYGYLRGIPDSSEPGGPAEKLIDLKRFFFIMTFEGMNAHDYFWDLQNILDKPDMTEWYEKNVAYFKLMGRFDLKKPQIVIARSVKVDRVSMGEEDTQHNNDPGRGDIQQAHHGYLFCSERDLRDGLVNDYPVIIDDNFQTLEEADVDALEAYVRKGGSVVLNARSGRHSYVERNAWPIARLLGGKPAIRAEEGTLTFEKEPAILKDYAGKSFAAKGESVDWQKRDYFKDNVALEDAGPDVAVLARYEDGKPALTMRPLGKGRVVLLGCAFFRNSRDVNGFFMGSPEQTAFYKTLFRDLGVAPLVESAQDRLWAERFIANNGSTELLVLGNQDNKEKLAGAAVWDLGFAPGRVFDPVTGKDLPVKISGDRVTIDGLDLDPLEMRYYAVERRQADAVAALQHWLGRQEQLWKGVPAGRETPKPDLLWPIRVNGEFEVKQFESEAEALAAVKPEFIPDATWKTMPKGNWESVGLPKGEKFMAVYRKEFQVPPGWLVDLRRVELFWHAWPMGQYPADAWINAVKVVENNKPVAGVDLLALLRSGTNRLAVLCRARKPDGDGGFAAEIMLRPFTGASAEKLDISSGWIIHASDIDTYRADLPFNGEMVMARKSVLTPERYRNCSVWIEVACADPNHVTVVSTNGRLRFIGPSHGSAHWTGPFLMNITPDIRFGEENDIIIANGRVFGGAYGGGCKPQKAVIQKAELLFQPK